MKHWGTIVAFASTVALAMSCSSADSSKPAAKSAGAGGQAQTDGYGKSACGTCVASACASAITMCDADPNCASYLTCLDACPLGATGDADATCEAACPLPTGSAGMAAEVDLTTCRKSGPGAACSACGDTPDGGAGGGGNSCTAESTSVLMQTCPADMDADPCIKCQYEKCCASVTKVFDGGPATDFANCWLKCTDKDIACYDACQKQYPDGVVGFGEYDACSAVECQGPGICQHTACDACSFTKCSCEYANCETDAGCFAIYQCVAACSTLPCTKACTANPNTPGLDLYTTYAVCTTQQCIGECGGT